MTRKRPGKGSRGGKDPSGVKPGAHPPAGGPRGSPGIEERVVEAILSGDRDSEFVRACLLLKEAIESQDAGRKRELGRQAVALHVELAGLHERLVEAAAVEAAAPAAALEVRSAGEVVPAWGQPGRPVSPLHFGHNAVWVRGGLGLWDEAADRPDPDAFRLVSALRPGVLRFPAGTRAMRYHFAQAVGEHRIPQCDTFSGQPDATRYGLHEFMRIARDPAVNADVTLVSPWFDGTPQEAAALVAYANGDPSWTAPIGVDDNGIDWGTAGAWAARRVANLHPDPFGVKFLEVGNEQYLDHGTPPRQSCGLLGQFFPNERWVRGERIPTTARDHASEVSRTGQLVRSVDPRVLVGASAFTPTILPGMPRLGGQDAATAFAWLDSGDQDPWNVRLLRDAGDDFDFFILHPYDLRLSPAEPAALAEALRGTVAELRALDRAVRPGAAPKEVAVTEFGYLFFAGTLLGALLAASMVRVAIEEGLLMALRHILIEDRRSPFNLSEPFANSGAVLPPGHTRMPGYFAMEMLAGSLSGSAVGAVTDVPGLTAFATEDSAAGRAAVVLIRHAPFGSAWDVRVTLPPGQWSVTGQEISGPRLIAAEENGVHVAVAEIRPDNGTVRVTVRPHALVVLHFQSA